jgi:hypothetical protein
LASARGDPSSSSPNVTEVCRRKVAALELALDGDSINAEAGEIPRALIDRVVLTPHPTSWVASMPGSVATSPPCWR